MNGYLRLYRSFYRHWLWDQERVYNQPEAFLDLLQFAAFAPTKRVVQGKLISLEIGELVASERFLESRWKWSRTKVRQFLDILEKDQMLDRRKDQGETVLILCNYKEFQAAPSQEKTSKQTSKQTTEEPAGNQQRTSGEPNNKKDKNVKSEESAKPPARSRPAPSAFDAFLDAHPTEAANDLQAIADRINTLSPIWRKHPHLTGMEMQDLAHPMTAKAFMALEDRDWNLLRDYLRAVIPEEWAAEKFWQPNQRSQFIRSIGDVLQKAEIWAMKAKWNDAA